jgi:hypothetical protein
MPDPKHVFLSWLDWIHEGLGSLPSSQAVRIQFDDLGLEVPFPCFIVVGMLGLQVLIFLRIFVGPGEVRGLGIGIIDGEDVVEVDCGRALIKHMKDYQERAKITYRRPLATVVAPAFVSSNQTFRGI